MLYFGPAILHLQATVCDLLSEAECVRLRR